MRSSEYRKGRQTPVDIVLVTVVMYIDVTNFRGVYRKWSWQGPSPTDVGMLVACCFSFDGLLMVSQYRQEMGFDSICCLVQWHFLSTISALTFIIWFYTFPLSILPIYSCLCLFVPLSSALTFSNLHSTSTRLSLTGNRRISLTSQMKLGVSLQFPLLKKRKPGVLSIYISHM